MLLTIVSGHMVSSIPFAADQYPSIGQGTAFGCPSDFLGNRYVYTVVSARVRGLSIGINLNPDGRCNFDCLYCEVDRTRPQPEKALDVPVMVAELQRTLELANSGGLRMRPAYRSVPEGVMRLRCVAISGDGEPTLSPGFAEALEAILHLRACGRSPHFKLVLLTNASALDRPVVFNAVQLLRSFDEVWVKLDAGAQPHFDTINRPDCSLETVLANIRELARRRPVVIQSLFPSIRGQGPSPEEVEDYVQRLRELREAGAQLRLVQICSAREMPVHPQCGHLALLKLSEVAQKVRDVACLRAEVF